MKLSRFLMLGCAVMTMEIEAEGAPFTIEGTTGKADGFYKSGEPIVFSVRLLDDGKPLAGRQLDYVISDQDNNEWKGTLQTQAEPVALPAHSLEGPGWLFVQFTLLDDKGKAVKLKGKGPHGVGALVEPEKFKSKMTEPADYDEFWKSEKARLAACPMKVLECVKVEKTEDKYKGFDIFDMKIASVDGTPVSGYLTIPQGAKDKSLAAVVTYHGAGVRSSIIYCRPGAISFDVNAHGILNGQPKDYYDNLNKGELADYRSRGCTSRETMFHRNMCLRVLRALEYVRTLPQWNGHDLVAKGHSQGGQQAMAAAALDPLVTLCLANAPGFSNRAENVLRTKRGIGMPVYFRSMDKPREFWEAVSHASSYFDCVNFAKRIHCPIYMAEGFADTTCVPTSVFTVYNTLPADTPKVMSTKPSGNHSTTPDPAGDACLKALLDKIISGK